MRPYGYQRWHALRAHGHETGKRLGLIIPKAPARREATDEIRAGLEDLQEADQDKCSMACEEFDGLAIAQRPEGQ